MLLDSTVAAVYDRRWLTTPALIETPLQVETDLIREDLCYLTRSIPLVNVDSFAPAHFAPEGLPSALSRAANPAAWVPFGPTFG